MASDAYIDAYLDSYDQTQSAAFDIVNGRGAVEALNLIIDAQSGTRQGEIVGCLNAIAGTSGLGPVEALNQIIDAEGLTRRGEVVGCINELAGTSGLGLLAAIDAWANAGTF